MNYYNYFTEIEEHFVKRRGRSLLISPMDWALIAAWRDAGVPLNVALRGIDMAMDGFFARQHRSSSKVNSLCYCHDSVMTEYSSHLESGVGESSDGDKNTPGGEGSKAEKSEDLDRTQVLDYVFERIDEIGRLVETQYPEETPDGMSRVISRLKEVAEDLQTGGRFDSETLERDFALIDQLLADELKACLSPDQMHEWEKEAKKELKIYRKRLPKETFEKIYGNFIRDKIHRKFGIGELSLFRL